MSQLHPLEEADVLGKSVKSKHYDYLHEIASVVAEHGSYEDFKEIQKAKNTRESCDSKCAFYGNYAIHSLECDSQTLDDTSSSSEGEDYAQAYGN